MKLSTGIQRYLRYREAHLRANTVRGERVTLSGFLDAVGDREVSEITPPLIQLYAKDKSRLKPATLNKMRARMIGFLAFARRKGWGCGPEVMDAWPRQSEIHPWNKAPDDPEKILAAAPDGRRRAAAAIRVYSGISVPAIQELRVGDVELHERVITVRGKRRAISEKLARELSAWLTEYCDHNTVERGSYLIPSASDGPGGVLVPERPYARLTAVLGAIRREAGY